MTDITAALLQMAQRYADSEPSDTFAAYNDAIELSRALLALAADRDELHDLYAEALNTLRIRTGLVGWDSAMRARVGGGVTKVRCPKCGGSGRLTVDRWTAANDDREHTCEGCGGFGHVLQAKQPTAALDSYRAKVQR